ncbi:MAG: tRNA 2-thiouridine(34) synthase MnmA [Anaerolineales bacterium]|nr:tRNA 2-thiouridine(34) synthase MnmA [Anaerolineales bacterium]
MRKVVVAMSGGVDSSVAAALLQQQGHQVTGMMMRLWSEPGKEGTNRCCTPDSMALARRVAARLDIPFYAIDARDVFRSTVVEYFLDGYARGETPNPCLVCNRRVRWSFLLDRALAMGAEYLATGHYVRANEASDGHWQLLRGVDLTKDQSYVLHVLTQDKLKHALFPIGELPKTEVRRIAADMGLPTASRSDSQDLCFLAGEDYRSFIRRNAPGIADPGPIKTYDGREVGRHEGLAYYTIGQRKGLGLPSQVALYVLGKHAVTNTLIIGPKDQLGSRELAVDHINWISGTAPLEPFRAKVKIRYTAREAWAQILPLSNGNQARVVFDEPQRDITPGQAAVIYDGNLMLGGGLIIQKRTA